ncbi:hypothetical protein PG993_002569 [Apiospora rasikravindrae]|uniref:Uncharacterized protein n=1 Tax=Apiospora rasikravindrae TaxID=990691 RepID=A0ABR1TZR0_9PEZI
MARAREREYYRHFLSSKCFKDVIETESSNLAGEASRTLGRIAMKFKDYAGQTISGIMPLAVTAERLAPAYRHACELKAALILTSKRYVAQFICPEQQIDEAIMEIAGQVQEGRDSGVKFCLFPIIRLLSPEVNDEDPSTGKSLMDCRNLAIAKSQEEVTGELFQKGSVLA